MTGLGMMEELILSEEVSMESRQERASAGAILVPGKTFQTISKSCRNKDHLACQRESFQGSFT